MALPSRCCPRPSMAPELRQSLSHSDHARRSVEGHPCRPNGYISNKRIISDTVDTSTIGNEYLDILVRLLSRETKTPGVLPVGLLAQRFQTEVKRTKKTKPRAGGNPKVSELLGETLKQFIKRHSQWFRFDPTGEETLIHLLDSEEVVRPAKQSKNMVEPLRNGAGREIELQGGFILPHTWRNLSIPRSGSEIKLSCENENCVIEDEVSHSDVQNALHHCGELYDIWIAKDRAVVCFQTPSGAEAALAIGTLDLAVPLTVSAVTQQNLCHSLFLWDVSAADPHAFAAHLRAEFHGVRSIEWHSVNSRTHAIVEFATWRSCRTAKLYLDDAKHGGSKYGLQCQGIGKYQYCYLGMVLDMDCETHAQRRSIVCKLRDSNDRRVDWGDAAVMTELVEEMIGPVSKVLKPLKNSVQLVLESTDAVATAVATLQGFCLPDGSTVECEEGDLWKKKKGIVARALQQESIANSKLCLL